MADSPLMDELRRKVALSCRVLAQQALMTDVHGHVSARVPDSGEMLIRCRGPEEAGLLFTTDQDIRRVDFEGAGPEPGTDYFTPAELPIHGEILKVRPEVGCVIHAHPPGAVLCALGNIELRPILGAYDGGASLRLALDGVPVFPRSVLISRPELAAELMMFMGNKNVCLMRGHGITVTGRTVEEATVLAIRLETFCRVSWQLALAGKSAPELSKEDVKEFSQFVRRGGRAGALGERVQDSVWRYFVQLLDYQGPSSADVAMGVGQASPL